MRQSDPLLLELLKYGFHPCAFVEVWCGHDGAIRIAVDPAIALGDKLPCPRCTKAKFFKKLMMNQ